MNECPLLRKKCPSISTVKLQTTYVNNLISCLITHLFDTLLSHKRKVYLLWHHILFSRSWHPYVSAPRLLWFSLSRGICDMNNFMKMLCSLMCFMANTELIPLKQFWAEHLPIIFFQELKSQGKMHPLFSDNSWCVIFKYFYNFRGKWRGIKAIKDVLHSASNPGTRKGISLQQIPHKETKNRDCTCAQLNGETN